MAAEGRDRELCRGLGRLLGEEVRLGASVSGGSIHRAQALLLASGERLFLKVSPADRQALFKAEIDGLLALAAAVDPALPLRIPAVRASALLEDRAVLVLEWLPLATPGSRAGSDQAWHGLGAALAGLHRRSAEDPAINVGQGRYGWEHDNWIGSAPQRNRWCRDWAMFFRECRLAPQLAWAERQGHPFSGAAALLDRVDTWLAGHQPLPVLVHGDLWAGNGGVLADGRGTIFDPAVHCADREVDLAMAALFGGFPAAFFAGYDATWPRPAGHERRQCLYNLYHELNHANLFGGGYRSQAQTTIRALLADR
ncbi:MAG: fructosamine kinase family protein [Cyanobacteriota bacterium]